LPGKRILALLTTALLLVPTISISAVLAEQAAPGDFETAPIDRKSGLAAGFFAWCGYP